MPGLAIIVAACLTTAGCGGTGDAAMNAASSSGQNLARAYLQVDYAKVHVGETKTRIEHVWGPRHHPSKVIWSKKATECWDYSATGFPSYTFCFDGAGRLVMKGKGLE